MSSIDEHVVHDGKGTARTTRCRHYNKVFASRSKGRWCPHMRSCGSLPPQLRHYFSSYEHKRYARKPWNPSATTSESVSEPPTSPTLSSNTESSPGSPIAGAAGVNDTPSSPIATSAVKPGENSLLRASDATLGSGAATNFLHQPSDDITEVLLIHGPCSFTRSSWTGGNVSKADLLREVRDMAVDEEISLVTHESNHEGEILDWLLNSKENEIIVLCWVGRLSDSPTILRALELINNSVIVVSPIGVNHGTLPSIVVGGDVRLWTPIAQFGAGCGEES